MYKTAEYRIKHIFLINIESIFFMYVSISHAHSFIYQLLEIIFTCNINSNYTTILLNANVDFICFKII